MCSNKSSYSNPIYDIIDETNLSFSQPLMINIEPTCSFPCTNRNSIPLLLLANCLTSPPLTTHHNYVNQRINEIIEDEENLYAKPRKRCITLEDEPIIIPPKNKSILIKRAQLVSTTLPVATVLSSIDSSDEIDQFIARENDRVERVKLRRRQNRTTTTIINKQSEKRPPAFSNPNYVEIEILRDTKEEKLPKSILV
ncbi:unnamed protein product [Adineta steineri]|uniref:Uncharacterized protein n=1 Tax=Adineta steineri TaxID=433720 RepID=A0A820JY69_9BILA|nr:unnamed protein product [Adineta steineri]